MNGDRVIDHGGNALLGKPFLDQITLRYTNCVLMKNVLTARIAFRNHNAPHVTKGPVIAISCRASPRTPLVEVAELHAQNCCLKFIQTAVPTLLLTEIF